MPDQSAIACVLSLLRILADADAERDIGSLAKRFNTSMKTVRRDIQELRANGVVVSEEVGPFSRKT
ncbi:MAG: HTH domain-containing protein [Planctomycetota bacterium]